MLSKAEWGPSARLRALLVGLLLIAIVVAVYLLPGGSGKALASGRATAAAKPNPLPPSEPGWIHSTIAHMSLEEKVGQLFEVNGYGSSVRDTDPGTVQLNQEYYGVDNIAELIRKYHPGGIIYFGWAAAKNLQNPTQIAELSNGIQSVATREGAKVPMVISTDQEGGEVTRIAEPATVFPGNMPLGATRNLGLAQEAGRIMGRELRAMGINVDNAPVVDVNVEPLNQADGIRAYGDRVPLVSNFGAAQVRGFQTDQATNGVGATAKHWPGFGAAKENSDFSVAISPQTLSEVKQTNVPPFRAAMKEGLDRIMVTHLLYPNVTGNAITSLSHFWVDGFLRGQLHYDGPVVTDALDAAALRDLTPEQIALKAVHAGDDELLEVAQCSHSPLPCTPGTDKSDPSRDPAPADLVRAYPAILHAVERHEISRKRLDDSVARILALKWKLGLIRDPFVDVGNVNNVVGTPRHLAVAQQVADNSITLLKNSANLLPLAANSGKTVLVTGASSTTGTTMGTDIAARGLHSDVFVSGFDPSDANIATAVAKAQQDDLVIVNTFNAWAPDTQGQFTQQKLVNALVATGKPVILVAIGTPYDIAYFPGVSTFLTSYYGFDPVSIHPLVKVLFGEMQPAGKLPVTITEPPPSTVVLYPFGFHLALP
jgi:beta-N-acetylhexosaminidase